MIFVIFEVLLRRWPCDGVGSRGPDILKVLVNVDYRINHFELGSLEARVFVFFKSGGQHG